MGLNRQFVLLQPFLLLSAEWRRKPVYRIFGQAIILSEDLSLRILQLGARGLNEKPPAFSNTDDESLNTRNLPRQCPDLHPEF